MHTLLNLVISANMRWNQFKVRRPLVAAVQNTQAAQLKLLNAILRENQDTTFGRSHDFSAISNMEDYRAVVPVNDYDALAPFIESQMEGELALTAAPPLYYARTSGTTGRYKDIPLTHYGLQQVGHAQKHLSISLWRDTKFMQGSILGFASPMQEGRLANGIPYGAMSGSAHASISRIVARKFALPPTVFSITNIAAKYQAFCLAVLATKNLTGIATANPSTILKLVQLIEANMEHLLNALQGRPDDWLIPEARASLEEIKRRADGRHIAALRDKYQTGGKLSPDDIWPSLSSVATWTGGSCGIAINQLKNYLPGHVRFVEFGYGASEFMGSANISALSNTCMPLLNHHVYEFVKRADWEAGNHRFLGLHELEQGEDYYIFITTRSGLYRYNVNDIVRTEPGVGDCPAIAFLQKGKGVTNITGEKLSEHHLISAVSRCNSDHGLNAGGYLALADEEAARYHLLLDYRPQDTKVDLAQAIDQSLRTMNAEYDDKRASGRLRPLKLSRFRSNACETIKDWSVAKGVRESQYKPTILAYAKDWTDVLDGLVDCDQ